MDTFSKATFATSISLALLLSCGPQKKAFFDPLPVGAQVNLVAAPTSAQKSAASRFFGVEVRIAGKSVSGGEFSAFDSMNSMKPLFVEKLENQNNKLCAQKVLSAVNPDSSAVVFCEHSVSPREIQKLTLTDSGGVVHVASLLKFERSDAENGVSIYSVDFL